VSEGMVCGLSKGYDFPTLSFFVGFALSCFCASVQGYRQVTLKAIINHLKVFPNLDVMLT